MAEEEKQRSFGPQPYDFGQESAGGVTSPKVEGERRGDSEDRYSMHGAPDNPRSAREVVERGVVNVANPRGTAQATPEAADGSGTTTDTASQAMTFMPSSGVGEMTGSERKIRTLQDFLSQRDRPETSEERMKREKREKSARIISAISDGVRAIGNLYFTSQYAPNMYNPERDSQLKAMDASIEKAKKEREANADRYLRYALALGDAENERAKTVREIEAEQERRRLAREKGEREAETHGWTAALQPYKHREQEEKANKASEDARKAKAEADNAPALERAKLATERARAGSYDASAQNSRASAAAHGRANRGEFVAYDERGKEQKFRTKEAAEAYARQHGTWHEEEYEETTTTHTESETQGKSDRRTTKRQSRGYSKKPAMEEDTPPSRRKRADDNDDTPPSRRR